MATPGLVTAMISGVKGEFTFQKEPACHQYNILDILFIIDYGLLAINVNYCFCMKPIIKTCVFSGSCLSK